MTHSHSNERSRLSDIRVVEFCDLLEEPLFLAHPLIHLYTATREPGSEDILVVFTHESHPADLSKTRLDVSYDFELGGGAQDGNGVTLTDVRGIEYDIAVRGIEQWGRRGRVEQFRRAHFCVGWEVWWEDAYVCD